MKNSKKMKKSKNTWKFKEDKLGKHKNSKNTENT